MIVKNKRVLVYGMSSSGIWATNLLKKKHAKVYVYDDDFDALRNKNFKDCYLVNKLDEDTIATFDIIIVSPSIENDNINLDYARLHRIPIYSEMELGASFLKNVVAVTGTNGKTTTTELITKILSKSKHAYACGNIGYPVSRAVLEKKRGIFVIETSSFMLEHADSFSPHIATILNIEPDHLIRHKTMEEYTRLKMNIFKNLKPKDYAVVNLDSNITPNVDSMTITYSYKHNADVYLKNGYIYLHEHRLVALNELKLKGKHNILNIMCAVCYAYIYQIKPNKIREALLEFTPDQFRNESRVVKGIEFINDSKSTNIASTLASVNSVKNAIVLLLGGSNKGLDYTELFNNLPKRVKKIVAFGEIAESLELANAGKFDLHRAEDLRSAFDVAIQDLKRNDTVILSPATASYDQYANYIERGKHFNELVREYAKKQD